MMSDEGELENWAGSSSTVSTNQRIGVGFLLYQDFGEEIMRDGFCFQCSVQRHDISPDLSPSGLPGSLGVDREERG